MHRIHLKGPWEFEPVLPPGQTGQTSATPGKGTAKFPVTWQACLGDFRGTVRFTRRFNRPTNLGPHERVELVFDGLGGTAEIRLNHQPVGAIVLSTESARFEITTLLQLHNLLEVTITWTAESTGDGGLWGPVAIEISDIV